MDTMEYEYRGNRFTLTVNKNLYRNYGKYTIIGIHAMTSELYLPDVCNGVSVKEWDMKATGLRGGEKVRRIRIPAGISNIVIGNSFFPNLERLETDPDHPVFSTDGKMLFSRDGSRLFFSLGEGQRETAVVPGHVRKIEENAFSHTRCREIVFENPDVGADAEAFRDSAWLDGQKDYAVVGNMFFRFLGHRKELRVPEGVRRFHAGAFAGAVPEHLVTPILPGGRCAEDLNRGCGRGVKGICSEITLLSKKAGVNLSALRKMERLSAVNIREGHVRYCSVDGVVFSGDKKVLEFYPPGKRDKEYEIPDGVVKIAKSAFEGNGYLQELQMPDSVVSVGMGAFLNCGNLQKIKLSRNIREIPDASAYQNGGVFEGCRALNRISLPEKLQYLGSYAFYNTSLQEICVNGNLRQMGEYALGTVQMKEIHLPASVERLGKGALLYAERISAYEGTAKGLVAAVNAVQPDASQKRVNVEWRRCEVTVRHGRSDRTELFLIPGSLKRTMAYHLDMAWNGERIDYGEYDACFEGVTDTKERREFAELGILRTGKEAESPYVEYMRHSALKVASGLIRQGKEKEFLAFLKMGYLSEAALTRLLRLSNEQGMTICSAYLLEFSKGRKRNSSGRTAL